MHVINIHIWSVVKKGDYVENPYLLCKIIFYFIIKQRIYCGITYICFFGCRLYIYIYISEGQTISFQTFFVWALLLIVHTWNSSPLRSNLLRLQCPCTVLNNFWKAPWKSSCVSVSMTFLTDSFISSIVSLRQPLSLGNNLKSQGPTSGL